MRGDDHDGIVTHGQSIEFRMHMKNPAQTGSGCISDDMGITATMDKLRHRVYKCNDVLFTFFFTPIDL